jgi:ankyrin repeat protein
LALPAANEDHFNFPYALYCAAKNGHADCARLLLEAGAHPDQRHPAALYSPLKATVACDHVDCALVLLQAGARLDADIFHTELLSAAEIGNPTMVALLLSFGAEPSSQTFQGQSAKQVAKERGHERAAELIEAAERLARAQTEATDLDATLSNNATSLPKPRL